MSFIRTETHEHTLVITLDRPEARNAFNLAMANELEAVIDRFEADPALRVGIFRAEGPTFCAGQDLKARAQGERAYTARRGGFGILAAPPTKPLIAAVEGQALAGGMELTLCCDLIVASRTAVFGVTEVKRGLVAMGGGCFRLPRRVPYQIAMELLLTGDALSAEAMHRVGYVNRVVEPGTALDEAMQLASKIAANGPLALKASKGIARDSLTENWTEQDSWSRQMPYVEPVINSQDAKEGMKAFAEKRAPVWMGH